jgi:hypothetical protein
MLRLFLLLKGIILLRLSALGISAFHASAKIRVESRKSIHVGRLTENPNSTVPPAQQDVSLATYMSLPVEQYVLVPMPLNAKLSRINDDFLLTVPPIKFFSLQVQPIVTARVTLQQNQVLISSRKCRINSLGDGPSYIDNVKLNDRFQFQALCTLSCDANANTIMADTQITVDVDAPPPFSKIPTRILEATGNKAMQLSMNYIVQSFLKGLSEDYCRWASDAQYREMREALSSR